MHGGHTLQIVQGSCLALPTSTCLTMPWVCRLRPPPAKEKVDPPGLRDKVAALFDEWAHLSEDQPAEKVHAKFVGKLQAEGFLKVGCGNTCVLQGPVGSCSVGCTCHARPAGFCLICSFRALEI